MFDLAGRNVFLILVGHTAFHVNTGGIIFDELKILKGGSHIRLPNFRMLTHVKWDSSMSVSSRPGSAKALEQTSFRTDSDFKNSFKNFQPFP